MKLKDRPLHDLLGEIASWNRQDLANIDDVTPNAKMLRARGRVIKAALAKADKLEPS